MLVYLWLLLLIPFTVLSGSCLTRHEDDTQNTLPSLRVVLPYAFDDSSGASLILQGGSNNFRANGTLGAYFTDQQRVKVSYDFMEERLTYRFCTGKTHKWMQQSAGGLKYEYLLDDCGFKVLSLGGFYSYAPSKNLSSKEVLPLYTIDRHISGSNYWSVDLGTTAELWCGGYLGVELNYARLQYNNKFYKDKKLSGLGGKVSFDQYLDENFRLHVGGEWRRFSRFIEGKMSRSFCFECGALDVGIFASRFVGEHGLGNNTRYGIEIALGMQGIGPAQSYYTYDPCRCRTPCDLISWLAEAAVEMPAIYAISEQRQRCTGVPTTLTAEIDVSYTSEDLPLTIDTAFAFSGSELTFSMSGGFPAGATINPVTGQVTIPVETTGNFTFTVIASNACGSTSTTVVLTENNPG